MEVKYKPGDTKYYTKRQKVIRDLIHDYIHLTAFEISLIDTIYFQRLRDIKQLTSSFVFPNANHTRFEHSLGTFELTRRAINAVRENGVFITGEDADIPAFLEFNTVIAALLHDIGHSPFSHLGEKQFNPEALSTRLERALSKVLGNNDTAKRLSKKGARHEKLSCLVIIEKLWDKLREAGYTAGDSEVSLDIEYLCRCILGVRYDSAGELPGCMCGIKDGLAIANFCICLVNNKSFDMDSLDYIMRDTMYCAVSGMRIDTERLFSNMYVSQDGYPAFKRQAVSVLKAIIEEKNNDYLSVINHHTTLYSNFMYEFVFRRFKLDNLYEMENYFSAHAVLNNLVSDSDVFSMLKKKFAEFELKIVSDDFPNEDIKKKTIRAHDLLKRIFSRDFLKPFWKDIIEFEDFKKRNFKENDATFNRICTFFCNGEYAESYRSEAVPMMVYLVNELNSQVSTIMPQALKSHELFLISVEQKWLEKTNVNDLSIYIRENEVRNLGRYGGGSPYEYKLRKLKDVQPLSPYSDFYSKRGFYVYVKPIETKNTEVERTYYENLEKIIVRVLSYFADDATGTVNTVIKGTEHDKNIAIDKIKKDLWDWAVVEFKINK